MSVAITAIIRQPCHLARAAGGGFQGADNELALSGLARALERQRPAHKPHVVRVDGRRTVVCLCARQHGALKKCARDVILDASDPLRVHIRAVRIEAREEMDSVTVFCLGQKLISRHDGCAAPVAEARVDGQRLVFVGPRFGLVIFDQVRRPKLVYSRAAECLLRQVFPRRGQQRRDLAALASRTPEARPNSFHVRSV